VREKLERVKLEEKKLKLYWKCKVTFILKQFFLAKVYIHFEMERVFFFFI